MCSISYAGFSPDIVFETDDFVAVQGLVGAGLGVSTLPVWRCSHTAIRACAVAGVIELAVVIELVPVPAGTAST